MFKGIYGRVSVKETDVGLPNLVVRVYDLDPRGKDGQATGSKDNKQKLRIQDLTTRIGSVLTDSQGRFEIPFDSDVARHFGPDRVPDPVVAVMAPEGAASATDPNSRPDPDLVVNISYAPRFAAGAVEAYSIQVSEAQLAKFGIPVPTSDTPKRTAAEKVARYSEIVQHQWDVGDEIKSQLGKKLQARLTLQTRTQAKAKKAFSGLMAVTPSRRSDPALVKPGDDVGKVHTAAMEAGLKRLKAYGGGFGAQINNETLKSAGLEIGEGGTVSGKGDPAILRQGLFAATGSPDLIRVRDLKDAAPATSPAVVIPFAADAGDGAALASEGDGLAAEGTSNTLDAEGSPTAPITVDEANGDILSYVLGQLEDLPSAEDKIGVRPDLDALMADIAAFQPKGGPADSMAYHDFNVLEVAFEDVWTQAFSGDLKSQAEAVYAEATRLYAEAGLDEPDLGTADSIVELQQFISGITSTLGGGTTTATRGSGTCWGPSDDVKAAFPEAAAAWSTLGADQIMFIEQAAAKWKVDTNTADRDELRRAVHNLITQPTGPGGRLATLLSELGQMMSEPYAFDIFAPDTYNFGILLTYRQRWDPVAYQVGDLVSTIPLAPGENRKYSKKHVVKTSRAEKENDKSMSSSSFQSSQTGRAEEEIMRKSTTATNFQMASKGSFNIGIGSLDASTAFAINQEQQSAGTKKDFHEATLKAAQDYKHEHSLEVDASQSEEFEETSSGEISNPNTEITVTYLFYELQRRYQIYERIHRVRPVILVAQDVPSPHEVDEAWMIANQWIIARVLLDNSLRPALEYLSSGLAGDQVAIEVLKASWEAQRALVAKLEAMVTDQTIMRDALRQELVETSLQKAKAEASELPTAAKVFTLGLAPDAGQIAADMAQAEADAAKTRLGYVEQALADAQKKLTDASAAFHQATQDYSAAMQKNYSRTVAIDQLRIHVKQNILYYMQAIWNSEPKDQLFFRLYNKPVKWLAPTTGCTWVPDPPPPPTAIGSWVIGSTSVSTSSSGGLAIAKATLNTTRVTGSLKCAPEIGADERQLIEIADLDNPLGYKGNYIIFPLKESCYLTDYMMQEFIDDYFGVRDPDEFGNYSIDELTDYVQAIVDSPDASEDSKKAAKDYLLSRLSMPRPVRDEIIVPTGQLFIEALPGSHPLLEDFKLLHRAQDVRKVKAEVRHSELENLRLAARLVAGKLEDPEIEKRVLVDGGVNVTDT